MEKLLCSIIVVWWWNTDKHFVDCDLWETCRRVCGIFTHPPEFCLDGYATKFDIQNKKILKVGEWQDVFASKEQLLVSHSSSTTTGSTTTGSTTTTIKNEPDTATMLSVGPPHDANGSTMVQEPSRKDHPEEDTMTEVESK